MPRWLMWGVLLWCAGGSVAARPSVPPTLEVARIAGGVRIDGDLDDAGWQLASRTSDFTQYRPVDNVPPTVSTEVKIGYDDKYLYLAFVCHDDPGAIRATLTDRDQMFGDDFIGVILDTYGNADWAYEIYINPLGVQGDLRMLRDGNEDWRFDLVFESAARITEDGWQGEIAVPFSSLRFPNREEQTWRATFWRSHPRDNIYKYSWAPLEIGEPCFMCQFGHLTGINDVKPGTKLDLLPTIVSYQSSQLSDPDDLDSPFEDGNPDAEGALNVRYRVLPGLTAEAAVNPDFSQIESDADQIDVNTTFALFFPERRPFFQEGSDLYNTWIDAIYTRSINDPDAAFKLTGRMGRTSFFYLAAHDENSPAIVPFEERSAFVPFEKSTSNLARIRQSFLEDSHVGGLVTDRRLEGGGSNTVVGGDMAWRFLKNYQFLVQTLGSHTREPNNARLSEDYVQDTTFDSTFDGGAHTVAYDGESFNGHALFASVQREARLWVFDLNYFTMSPAFRADNGYVVRNDLREVSTWTALFFRPNGNIVTQVVPEISLGRVWNYRGIRKDEWIRSWLNIHFRKRTFLSFMFLLSREQLRGVWFDDIRMFSAYVENEFLDELHFGVDLDYGNTIARNVDPEPVMGRATTIYVWMAMKPLRQFTIEPSLSYLKLNVRDTGERLHEGSIFRTRFNYQLTRRLFVRTVVQYNDFGQHLSLEPLVTYKLNPFTVFYVGSVYDLAYEFGEVNYPEKVSRQFFMKFQYLFRS